MTIDDLACAAFGFFIGTLLLGALAASWWRMVRIQQDIITTQDKQIEYLRPICIEQKMTIKNLRNANHGLLQMLAERRVKVFYLSDAERQNARNN